MLALVIVVVAKLVLPVAVKLLVFVVLAFRLVTLAFVAKRLVTVLVIAFNILEKKLVLVALVNMLLVALSILKIDAPVLFTSPPKYGIVDPVLLLLIYITVVVPFNPAGPWAPETGTY